MGVSVSGGALFCYAANAAAANGCFLRPRRPAASAAERQVHKLMKKYIIGRILFVIPIMLILSAFTFALTYLSPSDPVTLYYESMGIKADRQMIEEKKEEMGLNDPFAVQYGRWLGNVFHGDLGTSYKYTTSVWSELTKRLPNTIVLTAATVVLTILITVPLGLLCAVYQNTFIDYLFRFISFLGVSMPSFWVGTLLMYAFGVKLHLLPIMGSGDLKHLILPAATLTFWMVSLYIRRLRGSALEEMNRDYMIGGLAKGLSRRRIILKQILPNSLLSVITMFGMSIGGLLGGATVVETIFEWQGIGKMAVDAIAVKDFPVIQGYVLWMAMIYVGVNLVVDPSYQFLDPRIRLGKK